MSEKPKVSVVIPVYNEASIIAQAVKNISAHLEETKLSYEILLCENGSRDNTWDLIQEMCAKDRRIRSVRVGKPGQGNYGLALKTGILAAEGDIVLNDEIDIGNFDFYDDAISILTNEPKVSMVVGSKTLASSNDKRPPLRRFATWCVNIILRLALGFRGTDTHGLKAWRRTELESIVRECITERDVFTSEFVIRTERAGFAVKEIPIEIEETRAARVPLMRRVPHVLKNIFSLVVALRFRERQANR